MPSATMARRPMSSARAPLSAMAPKNRSSVNSPRSPGQPSESDVLLIADARGLAGQVTQVEETRAPDDAAAHHVDLLDTRRVRQENALDADVEAHLAHREGATGPAPMPLDDDALEHLGALLVAFDDAIVHAHRVADAKLGEVRAKLRGLDVGDLERGVHERPKKRGVGTPLPWQPDRDALG